MSGPPPFTFAGQGYHYYTYPEPESYDFNRLLRAFRDPALRRRYLDDAEAVVAEYGLTPAQAAALRTLDVDTCVAAGAHPRRGGTGCGRPARDRDDRAAETGSGS
jgi:hypothetical protein